jgi:hypothetical protein
MAWDRALKRADKQTARLNNDQNRMTEDYKAERADLARRIETLDEEASIRYEHIRMLEEKLAKEHSPDGHSTHVTPLVIAFCGVNRIVLVRLVPHSSHISQPLDLCVFGIFKIVYKKEKQTKAMKGETRKIYRALLSFYKSTIVPMIRWSFVHAGFFLTPDNCLGPVGVNGTRSLERIEVPELPVDGAFMYPGTIDLPTRPGIPTHRGAPVPGPTSFAVSLAAYIEKVIQMS